MEIITENQTNIVDILSSATLWLSGEDKTSNNF